MAVRLAYMASLSPLPRLLLESIVLLAAYAVMLLFVMGQKGFYLDILNNLKRSSSVTTARAAEQIATEAVLTRAE